MNNKLNDIKIPDNIDEVIHRGVNKAVMDKKIKSKKNNRLVGSVAAGIGIIFAIGIVTPTSANIPIIGGVFEKIQDEIGFSGNYSKYATSINETVFHNGIGVTLSEVYCDGESLYVSYKVESEEEFKYTKYEYNPDRDYDITEEQAANIVGTQLLYAGEGKVNFSSENLNNHGVAGLEGKFIDNHTFVGVEKYDLEGINVDIPDEFEYKITIKNLRCMPWSGDEQDQVLKGKWSFKVPVKVDRESVKTITVNEINNEGYGVKDIRVTPFEIKIVTQHKSNKKIWDYYVEVYDESGNRLDFDNQRWNEDNCITTIQSKGKEYKSLEVVLYREILKKVDETTSTVEGYEEVMKTKIDINK